MAKKSSKQNQQQQMLIIGGGVLAALILAAAVIFLVQNEAEVDVCDANDESCYGLYLDVETGTTDEGIPYVGSNDAPIIVAEFGDFACPHCAEFHETMSLLIESYAAEGQAQFWYFPMTGLAPPYSQRSAEAALCAGAQGAFWQYHDEVFELQRAETSRAFVDDTLINMAEGMGLDGDEVKSCMNSGTPRLAINATQTQAAALGVTGTPQVFYSLDNGENWQQVNANFSQINSIIQQVASGG